MHGSGAAGLVTAAGAGVGVAQEVLAETEAAVGPLVPHLDTLRWGARCRERRAPAL